MKVNEYGIEFEYYALMQQIKGSNVSHLVVVCLAVQVDECSIKFEYYHAAKKNRNKGHYVHISPCSRIMNTMQQIKAGTKGQCILPCS
jgi:hypothetical protein